MNTNYFSIKLPHKVYHIIGTEHGLYDISETKILTDKSCGQRSRVVADAIPISESTVADLLTQAEKNRLKTKGKASEIRRFKKEEIV